MNWNFMKEGDIIIDIDSLRLYEITENNMEYVNILCIETNLIDRVYKQELNTFAKVSKQKEKTLRLLYEDLESGEWNYNAKSNR